MQGTLSSEPYLYAEFKCHARAVSQYGPLTQAAEVEAGSAFPFFFIIVIIALQEMEGETGNFEVL